MTNQQYSKKGRLWRSGLGLFILFVGLIFCVGILQTLPSFRVDLTEDKLYTLTGGSRAIVQKIEKPISLTFFFSEQVAEEYPQLRDYAKRVRELLNEYVLASDGKLSLTVVDPEPFSEAEDRASGYGLQGVPARMGGDPIYFGLVGQLDTSPSVPIENEAIRFFNAERESFLEYDISQLIYRLANASPTVVGVLTGESVLGGYDYETGRPTQSWLALEQLNKIATIRQLDTPLNRIDTDVDVLMVIHPQDLPQQTVYAIDQYVLAGGKTMIFVDPHFQSGASGQGMEANSSDLPQLFNAWGVEYSPDKVVADAQWAMRLPSSQNGLPIPHVGILALKSDSLMSDDITTTNLESINVAIAGSFKSVIDADASGPIKTHVVPMIVSSNNSMQMVVDEFVTQRDHGQILNQFAPADEALILATRIQGSVKSAFPSGIDDASTVEVAPDLPASDGAADRDAQSSDEPVKHLAESSGDINVIVVADVDILTDRLWVQVSNFFGQRVAAPWANNGDFIANVVENLSGSADLISVRARGQFSRPFQRVEELQSNAALRFREQEQLLLEKLQGLESKIQSLSRDEAGKHVLSLTTEQQGEIKNFEQEKLHIRKELRQVRHQLNKDIEALEKKMKLVNIILVPGLLTLGVIGMAVYRSRRHA